MSKQVKTKSKENKKSLPPVIDCFSSNQFEEKTAVRVLPAIYGTRYFSAHAAQFENQRIHQTRLDRSVLNKFGFFKNTRYLDTSSAHQSLAAWMTAASQPSLCSLQML